MAEDVNRDGKTYQQRWIEEFDKAKSKGTPEQAAAWLSSLFGGGDGGSKLGDEFYKDPAFDAAKDTGWQSYFERTAKAGPQAPVSGDPQLAAWQQESRRRQQTHIQDLMRAAAGDPNSYAQQQLQAGMSRARGGVAAVAGARRGLGAGAGLRGLGATQAGLDAEQGAQSALLLQQERMAAQEALVQALQTGREQDAAFDAMGARQTLAGQSEADRMYQQIVGLGAADTLGRTQNQLGLGAAAVGVDTAQRQLDSSMMNSLLGAGASGLSTAADAWQSGQAASNRSAIESAFNAPPSRKKRALGDFNSGDNNNGYA